MESKDKLKESDINPIQDASPPHPYQFFPCNFHKRRI